MIGARANEPELLVAVAGEDWDVHAADAVQRVRAREQTADPGVVGWIAKAYEQERRAAYTSGALLSLERRGRGGGTSLSPRMTVADWRRSQKNRYQQGRGYA